MSYVLAVDLGATNIRVALGTREGKLLVKVKEKTVREGDEYSVANQIVNIINKHFSNAIRKVAGIGIGSIGPLDLKKGRIIKPVNLPFKTVELKTPIEEKLGLKVRILNDAVAAVWGEKIFGLGVNVANIVYITLSTGIGAGVIVDNHLLLGKDGNAHEVGHIIVDFNGTMRCGCGKLGHWEAYASGRNIPEYAMYLIETKFSQLLGKSSLKKYVEDKKLSSETLFKEARKGDALALRIVEEIGKINAAGFASVINAYDPELITIGGAIALNNRELVLKYLTKYLDLYVINRKPKITITPLGEDIVLYGALAMIVQEPECSTAL
ncbi:MAG: ROK family protein [Thermoprotei archaeon]|nr:MAG: ROK family protein [Thermoprotei archaeon]